MFLNTGLPERMVSGRISGYDGLLSVGLEKAELGTDGKTSRSGKRGGGGVECFLTSNRSTLEISKLSTRFGTIYMLYWDKE